jgi:hypothetical protein
MQFADCIPRRGEPFLCMAPSEIHAQACPLHRFHRVAGPQFETQPIKQHRIHLAAPFSSNWDHESTLSLLDKALPRPFGAGFYHLPGLLPGSTRKSKTNKNSVRLLNLDVSTSLQSRGRAIHFNNVFSTQAACSKQAHPAPLRVRFLQAHTNLQAGYSRHSACAPQVRVQINWLWPPVASTPKEHQINGLNPRGGTSSSQASAATGPTRPCGRATRPFHKVPPHGRRVKARCPSHCERRVYGLDS